MKVHENDNENDHKATEIAVVREYLLGTVNYTRQSLLEWTYQDFYLEMQVDKHVLYHALTRMQLDLGLGLGLEPNQPAWTKIQSSNSDYLEMIDGSYRNVK